MHAKWKIFSPEPLNDYNQKLLNEVKKMIEQLKNSINDIDAVFKQKKDLLGDLENEILNNKEAIEYDEALENYKINFLNHNCSVLCRRFPIITLCNKVIGNSIEK